jgi:hypothetical protein
MVSSTDIEMRGIVSPTTLAEAYYPYRTTEESGLSTCLSWFKFFYKPLPPISNKIVQEDIQLVRIIEAGLRVLTARCTSADYICDGSFNRQHPSSKPRTFSRG